MNKILYHALCFAALAMSSWLPAHGVGKSLMPDITTAVPVSSLKYQTATATLPAPALAAEESGTTDPAGEERVYVTNWMQLFGDAVVDNTGIAHRVRFGENNKVYFHDFFAVGYDTWIEGTVDDSGLITIPTHQTVATYQPFPEQMPEYELDITLECSKFVFTDDYMASEVNLEATEITLQLKPDGSIVSPDIEKDWTERTYPVAYARNQVYALCGAVNMVPCTFTVVTPPAGKEVEEYSYTHRLQNIFTKANIVSVVFDGEDVYMQGLCPSLPEIWLKGTFNADHSRLQLSTGQYMGFSQYHHAFAAAHPNPNASADKPEEPNWLIDETLSLIVNPDGKTFIFPTDCNLCVTINNDVAAAYYSAKLTPRVTAIGKPMKPIITTNGNELLWLEADFLPFVQPNADVDGNYIDTANLSWRLYYDDELFTFDPSEYQNLAYAYDEIPYCFADRWDFIVYEDVMEQCVAIYKTGYQHIGVESVYRLGDEMAVSERAYFGKKDGISKVESDAQITDTRYYDLSGRATSADMPGIYIRIDRMSDGSEKRSKIIVR
mgnify:CR=1 FL=1